MPTLKCVFDAGCDGAINYIFFVERQLSFQPPRPEHQEPTSDEVGMKKQANRDDACRLQHQLPTSDEVGMRPNGSDAVGMKKPTGAALVIIESTEAEKYCSQHCNVSQKRHTYLRGQYQASFYILKRVCQEQNEIIERKEIAGGLCSQLQRESRILSVHEKRSYSGRSLVHRGRNQCSETSNTPCDCCARGLDFQPPR